MTEIATTGTYNYFGQIVISRRVLFIIDTSDSMNGVEFEGWPDTPNEPLATKPPQGRGADKLNTITSPAWNQWIAENPECARIRRAKGELTRMVEALPTGTAFNILAFNVKLDRFQRGLVPANEPTKKQALRFIESLKLKPATAADLALAEAFKANDMADTIYLLSDGQPSRDGVRYMKIEPLLQSVQKANRYRRIIIHTLGFGKTSKVFLEPLAQQNGGKYTPVVGPPALEEEDAKDKKINKRRG